MVFQLLYILVGTVLLLCGGELLVRGAASLARALGVSAVLVGLTVVAYGTSAPEFCVSVLAAWKGRSGGAASAELAAICTGNIIGSNILNVLLILGLTAAIHPLKATADFVRREIPIMIAVSVLLAGFAYFGHALTRTQAALFLGLLVCYTLLAIALARKERQAVVREFETHPTLRRRSAALYVFMLVAGIGLLAGGSELFLRGAVGIAERFHVSKAVIGLTLVAVGTSLPELTASLVAAWRKHPDIALGNIVGSNIYNILGILGTAGILMPLPFDAAMLNVHIPVMLGTAIILWPMVATGRLVSRREGLVLLAMYAAYLGWTLSQIRTHQE